VKLPRFKLEDSWVAITGAFIGVTLITAFLTRPSLYELKQWSWDAILGHLVGLVLAVIMGFAFTFGVAEHLMKDETGKRIPRSRVASYTVCLLALVAFSVLLGFIWSAPVEPGDELDGSGTVATKYVPGKSLAQRDALIEKIFLTFLAPSLFGIRAALGPKSKT
jgi:formate hydrogenlyase subunit 3/multisubunit Na+/H+ antiporter MnhD subunit